MRTVRSLPCFEHRLERVYTPEAHYSTRDAMGKSGKKEKKKKETEKKRKHRDSSSSDDSSDEEYKRRKAEKLVGAGHHAFRCAALAAPGAPGQRAGSGSGTQAIRLQPGSMGGRSRARGALLECTSTCSSSRRASGRACRQQSAAAVISSVEPTRPGSRGHGKATGGKPGQSPMGRTSVGVHGPCWRLLGWPATDGFWRAGSTLVFKSRDGHP